MVVYGLSISGYVAFLVYGYRTAAGRALTIGWKVIAAPALLLVAWMTLINFLYLLVQVAIGIERVGVVDACSCAGAFHSTRVPRARRRSSASSSGW